VLIFMTDNGYAFGSHRWESKRCEFNECGQTPILIRYPGLSPHRDTTHLISNVDIAPTIAALAGATPAIATDGRSFLPFVLGQSASWRNSLLLHWPGGDMEGRAGQPDSMPQFWGVLARASDGGWWKYVEVDTGERELYDEDADPAEMNNRAGEPAVAGIQAELRSMLTTLKSQAGATATLRTDMPVPGPLGPDFD
jgi:arylsulfatase A-like enzyme